ncbi:reverse transcriptase domain-containing protein [Tanacetum coccineum]
MDLKTQLETVAKNHQDSIQNLETKFDRLADKQSGRPSGSLPTDLGASINLMPYSLYVKLSLENLKPTKISVRLADRSFQYPVGIAENMLVEVVIQVKQKQLNLGVGTERMIFNIDSAMKHSYSNDDTYFSIDVIDEILEEDFDALLDEGSKILHSIEGTLLEEEIFVENDETSDDSEVDDNFPRETLMEINTKDEPWFADFANYLEEPYLFKVCSDGMIRCCISGPETQTILEECHHGPTGGHYGPNITAKKVFDSRFYWPTIIKEAHTLVRLCEACQKMGNISKRDKMPLNNIQVCKSFDIWGIDFMGPLPKSYKFEYILVAVDYVSKWAKAQALPTNDARVVITFLKKLFCRFRMPKALISDRGTHLCNKIMERTMKRYGVNHRFSTSYHPQTSGQVKNTNKDLKRILEKTVKDNPAIWSRKLDDTL